MAQKNLRRGSAAVKKKPKQPDLQRIGAELRLITCRLEVVESCLIVINMALDGQNVEQDFKISVVLKHVLNGLLFDQIRELKNVAAKCDGGRCSERNDDNESAVALEGAP